MASKEEMLEEWDWQLQVPTGNPVARSIAHKQGIAHEGVHLWVVRTQPQKEILFQMRAAHKDMYPNYLDITVGGHVPFGLSSNKIQKEAYEEIGITFDEIQLIDLGYYKYEEINDTIFHREFQRVYILLSNNPLSTYSFNDNEVSSIYAVPLDYCKDLFNKDYPITVEAFNGTETFRDTISKKDFHPLLFAPSMTRYMEILFQAIDELFTKGEVTVSMS
jgi:isopentenyldiphosphate isomerase